MFELIPDLSWSEWISVVSLPCSILSGVASSVITVKLSMKPRIVAKLVPDPHSRDVCELILRASGRTITYREISIPGCSIGVPKKPLSTAQTCGGAGVLEDEEPGELDETSWRPERLSGTFTVGDDYQPLHFWVRRDDGFKKNGISFKLRKGFFSSVSGDAALN